MNFNAKNILITGASSGIGHLMLKEILNKNVNKIIVWDLNPPLIKDDRIVYFKVDLSHLENIPSFIEKSLKALNDRLDVLINNAGIIISKDFKNHNFSDINKTMNINALAPMHTTLGFLPIFEKQGSGHIVTLSSAASLLGVPKMSIYCASKYAMTGWMDSLRIELKEQKSAIKTTTIMPYYINTGMFDGVQSRFLPILKPEYVALKIIKAIEQDQKILCMPRLVYILPFLKGILPTFLFDAIVGKLIGIYSTLDHFKGRA